MCKRAHSGGIGRPSAPIICGGRTRAGCVSCWREDTSLSGRVCPRDEHRGSDSLLWPIPRSRGRWNLDQRGVRSHAGTGRPGSPRRWVESERTRRRRNRWRSERVEVGDFGRPSLVGAAHAHAAAERGPNPSSPDTEAEAVVRLSLQRSPPLNRDSRNWQHDQTHLLAELRDREGADTRTDAKLLKQIRDKLP